MRTDAGSAPEPGTTTVGRLRRGGARLLGGPGRVTGVDVARGIAVLGMFTAHVGVTDSDLGSITGWLSIAHGRSSILFALVAGVSLALVTGRERPLAGDALGRARARLLVRAVLLLALVALLDLLGTRVLLILGFYAAYFVLALPFLRWPRRRLLAAAAVFALVGPPIVLWLPAVLARAGLRLPRDGSGAVTDFLVTGAYPAAVWMAYVLVGMAIGRSDLSSYALRSGMVVGGLCAAAVSEIVSERLVADAGGRQAIEDQVEAASEPFAGLADPWSAPWPTADHLVLAGPHHDTTFEVVGSGGFAVAVLGLCLYAGTVGSRVLAPLAAVGAMALTVYSLQIVAIWHWDLLGSETNRPLAVMVVVTLVAATAWRFLVGRGPLERLFGLVAARTAPAPPAEEEPNPAR
ncbi:heparan-alpha-glucosaminide N-acetyltransferase domain-containing protein [Isoptericola variabilis]|uniref:Heparan-alpha-glucosaminide N-acetyltransferase catalytic domain-containing protein n=1 Tax=Isoptericola variabilis (strain 225) TaxID=743718 RepID=F6FQH6_ISOV2|nr:heparan-alpha-glucosaminide N-acetyltransferase domain-containing protein [Isoptericola variabilis]AEG44872.1 hypothetical protein Isova_2147 [Isoptericola variabilis 225]